MLYKFHIKEQGFTLIELLIAIAISGIVIGAIFSFLIVQRKYFSVQEQITDMIQNARAAMDMITSELTMAGYNPTGAAFFGIPYDTSQLRINADLTGDGDLDDSNERIVYAYNATEKRITRKTGDGFNQPFAENVQTFDFQYLDANSNPTTVTANIRQVRITLTVRSSKPDPQYGENGGYRTYTLTSLVTPRNLAF